MNRRIENLSGADLRLMHKMLARIKLGIALDFSKDWMRVVEAQSYGLLSVRKHYNGQLLIEGLTPAGEAFLTRGLNP